jgi:DNA excision repair protein ERCC-6
MLVYTEKYDELAEELKLNPPKLKSKLDEKQKKLSLYKFKIEQGRSRIENAEEVKNKAMWHKADDFFCHSDFTKFYGNKSKKNNKYREIETSTGDKYQIDDFHIQLLYDHQIDALHWLLEQHSSNRGSLLGDEMGLGKTITTLSLLSCLRTTHLHTDKTTFGVTLLVCPATIQEQWKDETKLWATSLDVYTFTQEITSKQKLNDIFSKHKDDGWMIIITYESLRNYRKWFEHHTIYYAILDEGHKIKNPRAKVTIALKELDIDHRLILTGTPIQNTIEELWWLMDFIQPGKLSSLDVFRDEYCSHILKAGSIKATTLEIAMAKECTHRLRVLIRPHILRRTKQMLAISCNLQSKNEYIVFCNPSTPQILITMKLRDNVIHRTNLRCNNEMAKDDLSLISKGKFYPHSLFYLQIARKIANHPYLLFWDEAEQQLWFTRSNENDEEIKEKQELIELIYEQRDKSGKLKILESMLDEWYGVEQPTSKVLIFSQTKLILEVIGKMLKAKNIKHKVSFLTKIYQK